MARSFVARQKHWDEKWNRIISCKFFIWLNRCNVRVLPNRWGQPFWNCDQRCPFRNVACKANLRCKHHCGGHLQNINRRSVLCPTTQSKRCHQRKLPKGLHFANTCSACHHRGSFVRKSFVAVKRKYIKIETQGNFVLSPFSCEPSEPAAQFLRLPYRRTLITSGSEFWNDELSFKQAPPPSKSPLRRISLCAGDKLL